MNKIDINKKYKTRSGCPVRIYAVEDNIHGAFFNDKKWSIGEWNLYGVFFIGINNNDLDLIQKSLYGEFAIDAKVLAWDNGDELRAKERRHFSGANVDGKPTTWYAGKTSFTDNNKDEKWVWDNCELYIEEEDR